MLEDNINNVNEDIIISSSGSNLQEIYNDLIHNGFNITDVFCYNDNYTFVIKNISEIYINKKYLKENDFFIEENKIIKKR